MQIMAHRKCSACYQRQRRAALNPLRVVWDNMVQRCTNPNHERYADYGGRGITIDPRWLDYAAFEADMGPRPPDPADWTSRKAYWSIDRIDNDGNYEPGNVRWATPSEQAFNRRATVKAA